MAYTLLLGQSDAGCWARWPGGPPDLDATTTALLALTVHGMSAEDPALHRAYDYVAENGGVQGTDIFTRAFLALANACPGGHRPRMSTDMVSLPAWTGCSLSSLPAWGRVLAMSVAVTLSDQFGGSGPEAVELSRLTDGSAVYQAPSQSQSLVKRIATGIIRFANRLRGVSAGRAAYQQALTWVNERSENPDGPMARVDALIRGLIALRGNSSGSGERHIQVLTAALESLVQQQDSATRVAPGRSAIWDTANLISALCASGFDTGREAIQNAAGWLLEREATEPGDWQESNPNTRPSGWSRCGNGSRYPDIANTACVLTAFQNLRRESDEDAAPDGGLAINQSAFGLMDESQMAATTQRGLAWILSMQNPDGGWGYWERAEAGRNDTTRAGSPLVEGLSDAVDVSTAESTAMALSALRGFGYGRGTPVIDRALNWLTTQQHSEGFWNTPGCNDTMYITWRVLESLDKVSGESAANSRDKALRWVLDRQNTGGGWPPDHTGESSPMCSSWAVLSLLSSGEAPGELVGGGEYLLAAQNPDGTWQDNITQSPMAPGLVSYTDDLSCTCYCLTALGAFRNRTS